MSTQPTRVGNPSELKLHDGLTRMEAESKVRQLLRDDAKLRKLGGNGNYSHVEYRESYRRGHTLGDRSDVVRYAVWVTPLDGGSVENPVWPETGFRPVVSADGYYVQVHRFQDGVKGPYTGPSWVVSERYKAEKYAEQLNKANRYSNPRDRLPHGVTKSYLLKSFREGYAAGKRVAGRQGNPRSSRKPWWSHIGDSDAYHAVKMHLDQLHRPMSSAEVKNVVKRHLAYLEHGEHDPFFQWPGQGIPDSDIRAKVQRDFVRGVNKYNREIKSKRMFPSAGEPGRGMASPYYKNPQSLYKSFATQESAERAAAKLRGMGVHDPRVWKPGHASRVKPFHVEWMQHDNSKPLLVGGRRYRKGNPASESDSRYRDFHGVPPTERVEIRDEIHVHSHLAGLGDLIELKVKLVNGGVATLAAPDPDNIQERIILSSNEDGTQLYFVGGDPSIDLRKLSFSSSQRDKESVVVGEIAEFTYRTKKGFDKLKLIDYYHKSSEVGHEPKPMLLYDTVNQLMSISGGAYKITKRGVEN